MVVEIEAAQKIVRRIRIRIQSLQSCKHRIADIYPSEVDLLVSEIVDDCFRLISLILAETGHWEPGTFAESVHIAYKEMAVKKEDVQLISAIPALADQFITSDYQVESFISNIEHFSGAVETLCHNIIRYVIHTELPV